RFRRRKAIDEHLNGICRFFAASLVQVIIRGIQIKGVSMHKQRFLSHGTPVIGVMESLKIACGFYIPLGPKMGIGIIKFRKFGFFTATDYRQDLVIKDYGLVVILFLVIPVCCFVKLIPICALLQFIEFTA